MGMPRWSAFALATFMDPEEVISICGKPIEVPPDLKAVSEMLSPV
jgi:hypothetical protein